MAKAVEGATPGVVEQFFRFIENRGTIASLCLLTTSAIVLEVTEGVRWLAAGIALGALGVLSGGFAEIRSQNLRNELETKSAELVAAKSQSTEDREEAESAVANLDAGLGSALETLAKGLHEDLGLCGGDRITIYGYSHVGGDYKFLRLARFSKNASISDIGREVCDVSGFLGEIWEKEELQIVMPPVKHKAKYKKAHEKAGLDPETYENLSFPAQSYAGLRIDNPSNDAIGIVFVEGSKETCSAKHPMQDVPRSAMMSLVPLIMATTKQEDQGEPGA